MRVYVVVLIVLICCFVIIGCSECTKETVIYKTSFVIDTEGVTFLCEPPLKRYCNNATLRIGIKGDWAPEPPWTTLVFANNKRVRLKAVLTSNNGDAFISKIIGRAGGRLDIRFNPQIPKSACIENVRLISDTPIHCTDIFWYDFNAK